MTDELLERDPKPPTRRYPKAAPWGIRLYQRLTRTILRVITRLEVTGLERVPRTGPLVIAFNHLSYLDGPVLFGILPRNDITSVVGALMAKNPAIKFLIDQTGGIWIERGGSDREAIRAVLAELQAGRAVIVSPEGRISTTGQLIQAQRGPVFLADRAGAAILPVAMIGVASILPNVMKFRRTPVTVHIGHPITVQPGAGGNQKASIQLATDQLMAELASMLPPDYRGHYADAAPPQDKSANAASA